MRVRGTDAHGASFEGLAHTLDLTPTGVRLGAIRHQLKVLDTLTILYRQRRMEFTVVWTKLLNGSNEYQVGLQAFSQEKEPWGLSLSSSSPAANQGLRNIRSSLNTRTTHENSKQPVVKNLVVE